MGHLILLKEYGDLVLFPEIADFERVLNEFMEINWNLSMDEEQRVFEGRILAITGRAMAADRDDLGETNASQPPLACR
ncbi:hypothetical protein [Leptospirillum ferriphilum]|uniref:hypothetical protein n=1 Tax=Leptospirillum ferriphilum TaxID=178606 RepID=UPI000984BF1F|nr:hypothetical protein [Leptospirillum ferriphilum]OOH75896.1 hypothetical protein BOX30_11405 [Leptospirillum ferriphilum]